jgi:hypothetical protein
MNHYDYFILFVFLSKILFVVCGVWHFILVKKNKGENELSIKLAIWKEYFEFIFVVSMALLCLYLFNPLAEIRPAINKETRVLLFIFGWIILINCKWDLFFEQSKWFTLLQYFVTGRRGMTTDLITTF